MPISVDAKAFIQALIDFSKNQNAQHVRKMSALMVKHEEPIKQEQPQLQALNQSPEAIVTEYLDKLFSLSSDDADLLIDKLPIYKRTITANMVSFFKYISSSIEKADREFQKLFNLDEQAGAKVADFIDSVIDSSEDLTEADIANFKQRLILTPPWREPKQKTDIHFQALPF